MGRHEMAVAIFLREWAPWGAGNGPGISSHGATRRGWVGVGAIPMPRLPTLTPPPPELVIGIYPYGWSALKRTSKARSKSGSGRPSRASRGHLGPRTRKIGPANKFTG